MRSKKRKRDLAMSFLYNIDYRRYLSAKRTDNGQIWKVNLKTQVAFGHIGEIEFAQCVGGSGLEFFSIPQQMKPGPG